MSVEIQNDTDIKIPVSNNEITHWVNHTLRQLDKEGDICICIVDETSMTELNGQYRHLHKPTNVLSFPSELPEDIQQELNILGDMIICPTVLLTEAEQLNKPLIDHWAHICIHGVLHLLGYDHMEDNDAKVMQAEEIKLLTQLNFPNPYCEIEGAKVEH